MWCAALVTWGVAAVAGMGAAVYAPDVLPQFGPFAAPLRAGPSASPTPGASPSPGATVGPNAGARGPATTASATPTALVPLDTAPGARQRAADRAVRYATGRGWRSGIAVVDLVTGDVTTAGDAEGYFRAESTVKLFIAARLLADGAMNAATEPSARRMLTVSDDAAASALYAPAGGDALIGWVGARYGIARMGTPPVVGPGMWGSTQVTPAAMATFLARAHGDKAVGGWLVDALLDMRPVAADGTNQVVGLRVADPSALVKQGWGGDGDPADVEGAPSVGYVDQGRYAVAIYTTRLPESPLAEAQSVVTEQAKLLLPRGRMPRA